MELGAGVDRVSIRALGVVLSSGYLWEQRQPWQGAGTTITQPVALLLFISTIFVGWQVLDARRQGEAGQPHWSLAAAGGRSTARGYLRLFL